jgi:hypothetical protein
MKGISQEKTRDIKGESQPFGHGQQQVGLKEGLWAEMKDKTLY